MKLNSARIAWHDCMYSRWDSQASVVEQLGTLGRMVQTSERDRSLDVAIHQAMAGRIQGAIATLPLRLQAFGHHLYGPGTDDDIKEAAEELVFDLAYNRGEKMYAKKFEKARHVAAGVLERYRRIHQGGQSATHCEDCGEEIPEARRIAVLGCVRCTECADLEERRHG